MYNVRYRAMLNVMLCNVRRGVKCGDAMWNDGVVHGGYGGVLMQDVKCGCGIQSGVEWFDATLQGVKWLKMQCGMCGVVWNVWCNLYLNVVMCMAWCEVECERDGEW